jgi:hypothetical protein
MILNTKRKLLIKFNFYTVNREIKKCVSFTGLINNVVKSTSAIYVIRKKKLKKGSEMTQF